jgi:hypothetical protein
MEVYKMTVYDLTKEQLDELKYNYFWNDETQDILENCYLNPYEIPDDIIFRYYNGINFVNDDFCCTANIEVKYNA